MKLSRLSTVLVVVALLCTLVIPTWAATVQPESIPDIPCCECGYEHAYLTVRHVNGGKMIIWTHHCPRCGHTCAYIVIYIDD